MPDRLILAVLLCLAACTHTPSTCEAAQALDSQPPPSPPSGPSIEPDEGTKARAACGHVGQIAATSGIARAEVITLESDCVATFARLQLHHDALSDCVLGARSSDDILACERGVRAWPSLLGRTAATVPGICDHVIGIMQHELGEALPLGPEDIAKFREECIRDMGIERAKMDEATFQQQAACVLAARSLADMERCDKT